MGLAAWYKRLRHSYGYGVHSPYAYELVERAVSPGRYSWYGYYDIDAALGNAVLPRVRRNARMLLRLAAFLQPRTVFLPSHSHAAFHAALEAADSRMKVERHSNRAAECRMICTTGDYIPLATLKRHLERPGHIVALRDAPEGWAGQLFDGMKEGLMLRGARNVLLIAREGMHKISYTINI